MLAVRAVGTIVSGASRVGRNDARLHGCPTRHLPHLFDSAHSLRMPSLNLHTLLFPVSESRRRVERAYDFCVADRASAGGSARKNAEDSIGEMRAGSRSGARREKWCL